MNFKNAFFRFKRNSILILIISLSCSISLQSQWEWETLKAIGTPTARSEAGIVAYKNKIFLLGGRRINPTDEFDVKTKTWTQKSTPPIEIHHFQPIVIEDAIYMMGALTGGFPEEKPIDRILIYYPDKDQYVFGDSIPENRRRGGAGIAYYKNKIYMIGGLTNGHMDGYQSWLDSYDIRTGEWTVLDDAPEERDHFQAIILKDKLFAFAGRKTSHRNQQTMNLTNNLGNIYDLNSNLWLPVSPDFEIPTKRAGNGAFVWNKEVVFGGGESVSQISAHNEIEAYNYSQKTWRSWPKMNEGRHGTGFCIIKDYLYTASGSGNRGGGPELYTIERLKLPRE